MLKLRFDRYIKRHASVGVNQIIFSLGFRRVRSLLVVYRTFDRLLNKYNKAWLNTNLAKTPTSFRNCVKYFENRNIQSDFSYNCKFIANFGFIYTPGFLYETGFLPGLLKFSTSHIICVVSVRLFSFWNERALISKAVLEIEANAVIYRHTYIHILVFWVRGMYFVERSIHLIEEHLHTAGFGHR